MFVERKFEIYTSRVPKMLGSSPLEETRQHGMFGLKFATPTIARLERATPTFARLNLATPTRTFARLKLATPAHTVARLKVVSKLFIRTNR